MRSNRQGGVVLVNMHRIVGDRGPPVVGAPDEFLRRPGADPCTTNVVHAIGREDDAAAGACSYGARMHPAQRIASVPRRPTGLDVAIVAALLAWALGEAFLA